MSNQAQRTAARPPGRARSPRTALGQWRNLSLPVKFAMVMLVPVIVSLVLGIAVIVSALGNAGQYARANRITDLSAAVRVAVTATQNERRQAADPAADPQPAGTVRAATDSAVAAADGAFTSGAQAGDIDPVATAAWNSARQATAELPTIRNQSGARGADHSAAVGAYTQVIDSLLAFDRVLTTGVADAQLSRQALALYDLFAAREEVLYQQAVVLAGIDHGVMSVADVTSLHGSEARLASRISDFRAVASADGAAAFGRSVSGPVLASQSSLLGQAIDQSGGMSGMSAPDTMIRISPSDWNAANDQVAGGLSTVTGRLAGQLTSDAATLRDGASGTAGTASVVLVAALAIGIAMMIVVARQLLGSIGVLRRTARDVAAHQLPDAVERIRAGEPVDATARPVEVHTTDEVGQLARAFEAVHAEALRLAVEQANLRANYSELFVNLSRRSQSLVQRQLRLIEQLERDEEDPDQLSALFKLDHLATRMRRNNENLMVLSGSELGRGPSQPVTLADLLRAAVSEIEHYQRVVVQPPPDAHVAGYAAGDLVRLLAELLDNATAFSAPETPVTVASHRTKRSAVVIDIVDHGIGMTDEELVRANEQLGKPTGVEGRMSRRMGLFVISRLANQHGVRVRLHGGQDIPGLRVTITVPAELVGGDTGPALPPGGGVPSAPMVPDGPLPRRVRGANGYSGPHGQPFPTGPARSANGAPVNGTPLSPNGLGAPRPVADPIGSAMTVTIPALPSATSSGVGLFAPLAEDGTETPRGGGEAAQAPAPEVTPIFDDMLSAWFTAPAEDAEGESSEASAGWRFAADEGWKAVDAVVGATTEEYTSAGLPRRQPRALLLPGTVAVPEPAEPDAAPAAEVMRERLAGFQRGVRRGRELTGTRTESEVAEAEAFDYGRTPTAPEEPRAAAEATAEPARWPVDDTEHVRDMGDTGGFTSVGLPRRQPMALLLPGSVATQEAAARPRDAGVVRDRLSSFQRGARAGRGDTPAGQDDRVEHGFQW